MLYNYKQQLTFVLELTSTPALTNSFTTSEKPSFEAKCKAFNPF